MPLYCFQPQIITPSFLDYNVDVSILIFLTHHLLSGKSKDVFRARVCTFVLTLRMAYIFNYWLNKAKAVVLELLSTGSDFLESHKCRDPPEMGSPIQNCCFLGESPTALNGASHLTAGYFAGGDLSSAVLGCPGLCQE